ncbi:hypothetical protein DITRI_Ditri18aG0117900 [Diplodiscus trichospermus]
MTNRSGLPGNHGKKGKKAAKAREAKSSQLVTVSENPELIFYGRHSGGVALSKIELYKTESDPELSSYGYDKIPVDTECTDDGSFRHIQKFEHWGWRTLQSRVLDAERIYSLVVLQFDVAQNEDIVEHFLMENASAELQEINKAKGWPCKSGKTPKTLLFDPLTS